MDRETDCTCDPVGFTRAMRQAPSLAFNILAMPGATSGGTLKGAGKGATKAKKPGGNPPTVILPPCLMYPNLPGCGGGGTGGNS